MPELQHDANNIGKLHSLGQAFSQNSAVEIEDKFLRQALAAELSIAHKASGLQVQELAQMLQMKRRTVTSILTNYQGVTFPQFYKLCSALGLDIKEVSNRASRRALTLALADVGEKNNKEEQTSNADDLLTGEWKWKKS